MRLVRVLTAAASAAAILAAAHAASAAPSASQLIAKMKTCKAISTGKYKTDSETGKTISVCQATGGIWWKADMDIDCDGKVTSACSTKTDPWFQPDTALHSSTGQPLDASKLPYVVIPSESSLWRFSKSNIKLGAVVAVITNNKVEYGVFGDTGPAQIIGEASYAMASSLRVNPDPENGGSDGPVYYLVFPGTKVSPVESHTNAVSQGQALAQKFINSN
jgi:hypothetical protein